MFGSFCFRWRFIFEHKICLVLQAEVMIFVAFKNSTSALHKLAPGWFELESLCVFTLSLAWIQCVLVCSEACLQKACFFRPLIGIQTQPYSEAVVGLPFGIDLCDTSVPFSWVYSEWIMFGGFAFGGALFKDTTSIVLSAEVTLFITNLPFCINFGPIQSPIQSADLQKT